MKQKRLFGDETAGDEPTAGNGEPGAPAGEDAPQAEQLGRDADKGESARKSERDFDDSEDSGDEDRDFDESEDEADDDFDDERKEGDKEEDESDGSSIDEEDAYGDESDDDFTEEDEEDGVEEGEADEDVIPAARTATRAGRSEPKARTHVGRARSGPRRSMIAGAVLGAAIGDAMGHPTEFIGSIGSIRAKYGPQGVTGFELYWDRGGKRFAPYTDDTQMAEIVLRTLVEARANDDGLDATMRAMADGFVEWANHPQGGHRAPGNACLSGSRALARGVPWYEAGGPTAGGCGSVMRAYPFGLLFADDLMRAERWSVAHSKLTHRDPIALAACAAMAVGVARILRGESVLTVASEMVAAACRYSAPTAAMMARAIDEALAGIPPEITMDRLRAWAAHEAIAAGVYLFVRHPDDPAAAILEGANTPGDSDSIATIAGALCGARCGLEDLPAEWVRDVERSEDLLDLARRASDLG